MGSHTCQPNVKHRQHFEKCDGFQFFDTIRSANIFPFRGVTVMRLCGICKTQVLKGNDTHINKKVHSPLLTHDKKKDIMLCCKILTLRKNKN